MLSLIRCRNDDIILYLINDQGGINIIISLQQKYAFHVYYVYGTVLVVCMLRTRFYPKALRFESRVEERTERREEICDSAFDVYDGQLKFLPSAQYIPNLKVHS